MNVYQLAAPTAPPRNSGCRFRSSAVTIPNAGKYSTASCACFLPFDGEEGIQLKDQNDPIVTPYRFGAHNDFWKMIKCSLTDKVGN